MSIWTPATETEMVRGRQFGLRHVASNGKMFLGRIRVHRFFLRSEKPNDPPYKPAGFVKSVGSEVYFAK